LFSTLDILGALLHHLGYTRLVLANQLSQFITIPIRNMIDTSLHDLRDIKPPRRRPCPYHTGHLGYWICYCESLRQKVFRANLCTKDVPYCKMLRKGILKGCDNSNSIRLSAFFVIIHVTLRFSKELERYSPSYIHAYGMAKLALDHYKWFQSTGLHYVPFYSCLSKKD
jgi:hypothetical protein